MRDNSNTFSHEPVMLNECIEALSIKADGVYVDCTAGGGGHSSVIASRLSEEGALIALDRDSDAIDAATKRLCGSKCRIFIQKSNFSEFTSVIKCCGFDSVDGVLIDLGVSSFQLDNAARGFSYMQDAELDMRMDRDQVLTARDVVNSYSEDELKSVLYKWGEEKFAPKIARAIVTKREESPIETTLELADIIKSAIPPKSREGGHHPAKKSFQAIRIEVNREIDVIEPTLRAIVDGLKPGGRAAVITFHSIEDRIVKTTFKSMTGICTCPTDFPVCVCGCTKTVKIIVNGNAPSDDEIDRNPRARSARLRVVEKI